MTASAPTARNDPCPCGSGKRYKHCHGRAEASAAIAATPPASDADARALREAALGAAADPVRAEHLWERLLALVPGDAEALFHLGNLARARGDAATAVARFEAALAHAPGHTGVLNNLGLALEAAGRLDAAERVFRQALAAAPAAFEPLANLAQNLYQQNRYADALPLFDALIAKSPVTQAALHANRSVCLAHVGRLAEAEAALVRALELAPDSAALARDLAVHYVRTRRHEAAIPLLERSNALAPGDLLARSLLVGAKLHVARWDRFAEERAEQIAAARNVDEVPGASLSAFDFAVICDDPGLQQRAARSWSRGLGIGAQARAPQSPRSAGPLRVGFVATDFHNHPVGRLVVALFERLDRARCVVAAYAIGTQRDDEIATRIRAAADLYRSAPHVDAAAIAATIRADRIDVLIDLNGLTGTQLASVFAERPAPLQASFIGYTGTQGCDAYDCLIADRYCIPDEERAHYDERIVRVDPCYLPSDPARDCARVPVSRADYGLPGRGLVLGAPAPIYKILPPMFALWMAILARQAGSVLWLRAAAPAVEARLRDAAVAHGIDAARLVFAPAEPLPRYLARLRLADIVLDTHPFGAHTSVNDALFAGVPVITIAGRSFAGRASASQLAAAGLAELIARDPDDYLAIAERLAADGSRREAIAASLRQAAATSPLFDIARYARAFEGALESAWARTAHR